MTPNAIDSTEGFAWKFQLRVQWRNQMDQQDPATPSEGNSDSFFDHDCVLQCGDCVYRYRHDYIGPRTAAVVTLQTQRAMMAALRAILIQRGCLVLSERDAGKTELVREVAVLAGTQLEVVQCSSQMDAETLVNLFCGLVSNQAWACLRLFDQLNPDMVAVCASFFKVVVQAIEQRRTTVTFGAVEDVSLSNNFGLFITWSSFPEALRDPSPAELHPSIKSLLRPIFIRLPDLEIVLRFWLTARGFSQAGLLATKMSQVAAFGREVLRNVVHLDWSMRSLKHLVEACFRIRHKGMRNDSPEDIDEVALVQRQILHHYEGLVDGDSRLILRDFVNEIFDEDRVHADVLHSPTAKSHRISEVQGEMRRVNIRCTELAAESILDLEDILDTRHAVAVTGATATGKTHIWQGLARVLEERGAKVAARRMNPKVLSPAELYGYMNPATDTWKEGIVPFLLKDLMQRSDCRHRWLVIDGEMDSSWADGMQSLLDEKRVLSLADSEQLCLLPNTAIIIETKSLRFAAPSAVSRLALLNTMQTLDWENWMESWLESTSSIVHTRHAQIKQLMHLYVPQILPQVLHEIETVVPMTDIALVQTLCSLLDALITNENIPKSADDETKYIEKYFVFAAIWAFGSALEYESKRTFSLWWRQTFKSVRIPAKGTVFDYHINKAEFVTWSALLEEEQADAAMLAPQRVPSSPLMRMPSSSESSPKTAFVHTVDSLSARVIGGLASAMHLHLLLVGAGGTGKTALVAEMLEQLPSDFSKSHYQVNYRTDCRAMQAIFEGVLEKKAGNNFGPIASTYLALFLDDVNLEAVDRFDTQGGLELVRQMLDSKAWYDRAKYSLRVLNHTQIIAAMNPSRGNRYVHAVE